MRFGALCVVSALVGLPLACAEIIGAEFDRSRCPNERCVQSVAENLAYPYGIAVDDQWIYWTTAGVPRCAQGAGRVMRRSKTGGDVVVIAEAQSCPSRLVLDDTYVYWTNASPTDGKVQRLPKDAVPGIDVPEVLADAQPSPIGLAVDATHVYWTTGTPSVRVLALDKRDAGTADLLGPDATPWASSGVRDPSLLAIDQTHVYVTEFAFDGGVWKIPMDAGTCCPNDASVCADAGDPCEYSVRLTVDQPIPNGIVVDLSTVYFVTYSRPGAVKAVQKHALAGPAQELASDQNKPADLATDGAYLYWTNSGDGTIRRVPMPGGTPETIASDQGAPNCVAVDETYVYWTVHAEGGGVRMAPKVPER